MCRHVAYLGPTVTLAELLLAPEHSLVDQARAPREGVDPRNAELLAARIPGAALEWFDGAGHLFPWEEPDRFARAVTEFLA